MQITLANILVDVPDRALHFYKSMLDHDMPILAGDAESTEEIAASHIEFVSLRMIHISRSRAPPSAFVNLV